MVVVVTHQLSWQRSSNGRRTSERVHVFQGCSIMYSFLHYSQADKQAETLDLTACLVPACFVICRYCSRECQVAHRQQHQELCGRLQQAATPVASNVSQLLDLNAS